MSPLDIFKTAIWSVGSNKLRSGLTLLGIVIGVTAVIALMTIGRGVQESITSRISSQGANVLTVTSGSSDTGNFSGSGGQGSLTTISLEDAYALVDPLFGPSIQAVAPQISTNAQIVNGRLNTSAQVLGVTTDYATVRNLTVEIGQFISQAHVQNISDVAVLSSGVSEELFGTRNPLGQDVRINGRYFTVIGVLEESATSGFGFSSSQVYMPVTTVNYRLSSQRTTDGQVGVQTIYVQAAGPKQMEDAESEISTILRLRHRIGIGADDDFTISSQQSLIETLEATTNTLVIFLGSIAGISLFVGGIGVMNIMLVSVTERTREIGIRKAIGAKKRDIMFQFVTEAVLLTMTGGLIGLLIGFGLTPLLNGFQLFGPAGVGNASIDLDIGLMAMAVSVMIGLFSGIYPALRAANMHPIDALRYE